MRNITKYSTEKFYFNKLTVFKMEIKYLKIAINHNLI